MKIYRLSDFNKDEAWLMFRVDMLVADNYVDVYIALHLPSEFVLGHEIIENDVSQQQADAFFKQCAEKGRLPSRVLLATGDPAEAYFRQAGATYSMTLETVPARCIDELIAPLKRSFGTQFHSPSTVGYGSSNEVDDDPDSAKQFIPDSYDQCPYASGKKYKFCCKKILPEITNAMVAAEDGDKLDALRWIQKAKDRVGDTAEILCREVIVYSFFDTYKSQELLQLCLDRHPNHPRAHYIRAIDLSDSMDIHGAIAAYQTAISNYPETDHFHLNEAYNNLGTAFYKLGDREKAKSAWEKALLYLPSDQMTQNNLREFIYAQGEKFF